MRACRVAALLSTLFAAGSVTALSMSFPEHPDEWVLENADTIVLGSVVEVRALEQPAWKSAIESAYRLLAVEPPAWVAPCYDFVYRLRVTQSFKGEYSVGESATVGSFRHLGMVRTGDRQLAALKAVHRSYYEQCHVGDEVEIRFPVETIVSPPGGKSGVFMVFRDPVGTERFQAVNCFTQQVLYAEHFHRTSMTPPGRHVVVGGVHGCRG